MKSIKALGSDFFFVFEFFKKFHVGGQNRVKLENYSEFSRFLPCAQPYWLENTKRNALDISDFRNLVHHRMFLGSM